MDDVRGIEGLSTADVQAQVARFVVHSYGISGLVMTFERSSVTHFMRAGESRVTAGLPYTLLSCVLENFGGGRDVTTERMRAVR